MTSAEGCISMGDAVVVRSHVLNFGSEEHNWHGDVNTDEELQELERALLGLGVSFKVTSSRQHADEKNRATGETVMFSINRGAVSFDLDMPFRVLSLTDKGCLYGKDKHTHRSQPSFSAADTGDQCHGDWTAETFKMSRVKLQSTKKKGCIATMRIKKSKSSRIMRLQSKDAAKTRLPCSSRLLLQACWHNSTEKTHQDLRHGCTSRSPRCLLTRNTTSAAS
ncbi:unnamed protein product [Ixodes persulcatus]